MDIFWKHTLLLVATFKLHVYYVCRHLILKKEIFQLTSAHRLLFVVILNILSIEQANRGDCFNNLGK